MTNKNIIVQNIINKLSNISILMQSTLSYTLLNSTLPVTNFNVQITKMCLDSIWREAYLVYPINSHYVRSNIISSLDKSFYMISHHKHITLMNDLLRDNFGPQLYNTLFNMMIERFE